MTLVAPVSAKVPDWSRETPRKFWDPGRKLIRSIRRYQNLSKENSVLSNLMKRYWSLEHVFWSVITQSEIHLDCRIDGGLLLTHPNGIIIHPNAKIGPNCLIFHQVTVGLGKGGVPTIGGHVDIGAGAKIIGGITVGDHAIIGVNSVVLNNVPRGAVVAGVPARVIRMQEWIEPTQDASPKMR